MTPPTPNPNSMIISPSHLHCVAAMFTAISLIPVSAMALDQDESARVRGPQIQWQTLTIDYKGPEASESDNEPNPFLDYRMQVLFIAPSGKVYNVPGFFDGDGRGGERGNVWRVRFTPPEPGEWRYELQFRVGDEIAVELDSPGSSTPYDGVEGVLYVDEKDPDAPGFAKWGILEYAGGHYFKFRDGPYWLKGGTDSPENFLGYHGFDNTTHTGERYDGLDWLPALHRYEAHVKDWQDGDPDWSNGAGRGIIGAINYLASKNVNSIYMLLMNIGGDGKDVFPWAGSPDPRGSPDNDNLHFDISKLSQWETVFAHAQRKGLFLHLVLNEAEEPNKRELDNGELGVERKVFYREMVARFGHHLAMQWNLCEEYNLGFDLGPDRIRSFADYLRAIDPYGHPITVHSAHDPLQALDFIFGDDRFDTTSVQLNQRRIDQVTEAIRRASAEAGRPLPAMMDEFTADAGGNRSWIPVDNAERSRKQKLWPTYFSGGNIEFILEGFLSVDQFNTSERELLWDYMWYARQFLQDHLPFWEMQPMDELVEGESTLTVGEGGGNYSEMGAQVFAKPGEVYAIYFPVASNTGMLDLSSEEGDWELRWYNPRNGLFTGPYKIIPARRRIAIGASPGEMEEDWVALLRPRLQDR